MYSLSLYLSWSLSLSLLKLQQRRQWRRFSLFFALFSLWRRRPLLPYIESAISNCMCISRALNNTLLIRPSGWAKVFATLGYNRHLHTPTFKLFLITSSSWIIIWHERAWSASISQTVKLKKRKKDMNGLTLAAGSNWTHNINRLNIQRLTESTSWPWWTWWLLLLYAICNNSSSCFVKSFTFHLITRPKFLLI